MRCSGPITGVRFECPSGECIQGTLAGPLGGRPAAGTEAPVRLLTLFAQVSEGTEIQCSAYKKCILQKLE